MVVYMLLDTCYRPHFDFYTQPTQFETLADLHLQMLQENAVRCILR